MRPDHKSSDQSAQKSALSNVVSLICRPNLLLSAQMHGRMSELESVKTEKCHKCQNWKVSKMDCTRMGKCKECQKWKV